jgi:hypothetical protein
VAIARSAKDNLPVARSGENRQIVQRHVVYANPCKSPGVMAPAKAGLLKADLAQSNIILKPKNEKNHTS